MRIFWTQLYIFQEAFFVKITTFGNYFVKNLIIDVWNNPKYASENFKYKSLKLFLYVV